MAIHIRSGARLNGYTLRTDMVNSDAGTSMWALAEKDGRDFFIKCFLSPTFPSDASPGSAKSKEKRRARCRHFEAHIRAVEQALARCGDQAFLVPSVDFFREGGTYFKVTKKVPSNKVCVHVLPPSKQLIVLLTAAYGVKSLHLRTSLVHADLKPENILLHGAGNRYLANLIDFDAAFFHHTLPDKESLIGDQRYWPPELVEYLNGARTGGLSQKIDVFALGLIFCEFLTGQPPILPEGYDYASEALLHGAELEIAPLKHAALAPVVPIIEEMLQKNAEKRPTIASVHERLRKLNKALYVRTSTLASVGKMLKRPAPAALPVIPTVASEDTGLSTRDSKPAKPGAKLNALNNQDPMTSPSARNRR